MSKMDRWWFLFKNGRVMAVLRPKDADLKMKHLEEILKNAPKETHEVLFDVAPPKFLDYFHKEVWDGQEVIVLPNPDRTMDSNTGIICSGPNRGGIALRGGITEPDCHLPTLNKIWTGDPNCYWKTYEHNPPTPTPPKPRPPPEA